MNYINNSVFFSFYRETVIIKRERATRWQWRKTCVLNFPVESARQSEENLRKSGFFAAESLLSLRLQSSAEFHTSSAFHETAIRKAIVIFFFFFCVNHIAGVHAWRQENALFLRTSVMYILFIVRARDKTGKSAAHFQQCMTSWLRAANSKITFVRLTQLRWWVLFYLFVSHFNLSIE